MGRQRVASLSGYASEPPPANAHAQRRRSGAGSVRRPSTHDAVDDSQVRKPCGPAPAGSFQDRL